MYERHKIHFLWKFKNFRMCIFEKKTLFFVIYVSLKYIMDLYKFLILDYIGKVENYSIKMFTHYLNMKIAYFHAIERNWVKMYYF